MFGPRGIDTANPINQSSPFARGLLGWWKVLPDAGPASTWRDLLGRSPATAAGTVTKHSSLGLPGSYGSMFLNGGYYTMTLGGTMPVMTSGVLSGWVYPTTVNSYSMVIGTRGGGAVQPAIVAKTDAGGGNVTFHWDLDEWNYNSGIALQTNQWNWVGVSIYSSAASYIAIYNSSGWQTFSDSNSNDVGRTMPSTNWSIGIDYNYIPSSRNIVGYFDDIAVRIGVPYTLSDLYALFQESRLGYPSLLNRQQRIPWPKASAAAFKSAWARNSNVLIGAGAA